MSSKVIIGCERSGVVRRAFRSLGIDAWSCDLEDSDDQSEFHIKGDIRIILNMSTWRLGIFHPPCTYLCNSGVRWLSGPSGLNAERHALMMNGCDLFADLYHADIPLVCVENPVMHKYARDYLLSAWKVPSHSQTIQPWQFGHGEVKRTCLWTRGLPDLKPTLIVHGRNARIHRMQPGPERSRLRSVTYEGITKAMADQWGKLL